MIALSSIATTATKTSIASTGLGIPYSIPTAFATATVCGSMSKAVNTKIRNKIMKFSQMYIYLNNSAINLMSLTLCQ